MKCTTTARREVVNYDVVQPSMIIAIRTIGVFLVIMATLNLGAWFVAADHSLFNSSTVYVIRYTLMLVSGLGFILLRRWGVYIYATSFVINWVVFLTIFHDKSVGPLWLSFPIPVAIFLLAYFAWGKLRSGI